MSTYLTHEEGEGLPGIQSFFAEGGQRRLALGLGAGRIAIGGLLAARTALLARLLGVDAVTARRTRWLTGMIAGRELALGLGTLDGVRRGGALGPWLIAQALSDTGDAIAVGAAAGRGDVRRVLAGPLVLAAVAGAVTGALGALAAGSSPSSG